LGLGNGKAVSYSVGVGRANKQWTGQKRISSKRVRPAWSPTAQIIRDKPGIAKVIPGGSPKNPMGAAALILSGAGQYAIHGTNNPGSIGGFVSYGCIRMYNEDIKDLFDRVRVGTKVTVNK
jgi:lipoprotein-anchoring transpeptidase ErfK/SrfK